MAWAISQARGRCIASARVSSFVQVSGVSRTETVLLGIVCSLVVYCIGKYSIGKPYTMPQQRWRSASRVPHSYHGTQCLSVPCDAADPKSWFQTVGVIFWFTRKKLVGSYLFLITTRRW